MEICKSVIGGLFVEPENQTQEQHDKLLPLLVDAVKGFRDEEAIERTTHQEIVNQGRAALPEIFHPQTQTSFSQSIAQVLPPGETISGIHIPHRFARYRDVSMRRRMPGVTDVTSEHEQN